MRTLSTVALLTALITSSASFAFGAGDGKAGQAVYEKHCASCHGPNGAAPPNVVKFVDGRMTDLRASRIQSMSDPDLSAIITKGKGKMHGDTTVSGKDMADLIAYIHSLKIS